MKIKILANPKKPWARELADEIKAFLSPRHSIVRDGADATICIGGDGTILYAAHKGRIEGAVLGIGSEKSYICQLRNTDWKGRLLPLLESKKTVSIMTLRCMLGAKRVTALNDFLVHATNYRVAELEVAYDDGRGKRRTAFEGDGIIISSALGSAAYAFSAGGEMMAPTERKLSLVPICPYKRAFSPKTLPEDAKAAVKVGSDCAFIVDGIYVRKLRKGEIVEIGKGEDVRFFIGVGMHDP
jgi:NAD+ kinase